VTSPVNKDINEYASDYDPTSDSSVTDIWISDVLYWKSASHWFSNDVQLTSDTGLNYDLDRLSSIWMVISWSVGMVNGPSTIGD